MAGISIHAPVKGATQVQQRCEALGDISIHAPVKGATIDMMDLLSAAENFNPRSREGSDSKNLQLCRLCFLAFQSTLP